MTRYKMSIGITVFGSSNKSEWNFDYIIPEFKQFIEANSKFDLNLVINTHPALANDEIGFWSNRNPQCYFMAPGNLRKSTKQLIPSNVQINIVPYLYNNLEPVCWTAGTWGGDIGLYGKPWISEPFGYTYSQFPPWQYHATQDLVHEWLHTLDSLLISLGFPEFPAGHNIHDCTNLGYVIENGWMDCYKYYLSTITDQMYEAIKNNEPQPCNDVSVQLTILAP